jgi:uncharacterized protein (DUF488 family)
VGRARQTPPVILTVGHSTRSLEELIALLEAHGVTLLADIRTVPRSRRNPQYDRATMPAALRPAGIEYVHLPALGGLRHTRKDSPNLGWRNASFRGYADCMQTPAFAAAIADLIDRARAARLAVMCAEAVPWRCHRSLVADALTARGVPVEHIMSATRRDPHRLTSFARVDGDRVTYPAAPPELPGTGPG